MGLNDQVQAVSRPEWLASQQGRGFMAGSSALVIAVASNIRCTLTNPANSDRRVVLTSARGYTSTGGALYGRIILNPTTNLPTIVKTPMNLRLSASPSTANAVMKVEAGVIAGTALGGGTDTGIDLVITNGVQQYDDPITIDPGQTLGLNVPVPLALVGTVVLDLRWYETGLNG